MRYQGYAGYVGMVLDMQCRCSSTSVLCRYGMLRCMGYNASYVASYGIMRRILRRMGYADGYFTYITKNSGNT